MAGQDAQRRHGDRRRAADSVDVDEARRRQRSVRIVTGPVLGLKPRAPWIRKPRCARGSWSPSRPRSPQRRSAPDASARAHAAEADAAVGSQRHAADHLDHRLGRRPPAPRPARACGTRRSSFPTAARSPSPKRCSASRSSSRRVYWVTADPVLTYNVAFLLSFALAGAGMYLLARELTGSRAAAFVAGMYYAFGPFRMAQIAHVQMVATGWIPVALWGLHRYFSTRRAALAGRLRRRVDPADAVEHRTSATSSPCRSPSSSPTACWRARGDARPRRCSSWRAAGVLIGAALAPVGAAYYRARTRLSPGAQHRRDRGRQRRRARVHRRQEHDRRLALAADRRGDRSREGAVPGLFAVAPRRARRLDRASRSAAAALGAASTAIVVVDGGRRCRSGPSVRVWGALVTTHGPYRLAARASCPAWTACACPRGSRSSSSPALSVLVAFGVDVAARARQAAGASGRDLPSCLADDRRGRLGRADLRSSATARAAVRRIAPSPRGWPIARPARVLHLPVRAGRRIRRSTISS